VVEAAEDTENWAFTLPIQNALGKVVDAQTLLSTALQLCLVLLLNIQLKRHTQHLLSLNRSQRCLVLPCQFLPQRNLHQWRHHM